MQLLVFLGGLALAIVGGLCEFVGGPAVHGWSNWAMMIVGGLAMAGGLGASPSDEPDPIGDPCKISSYPILAQYRDECKREEAIRASRKKTVPYVTPIKRDASEFVKPETREVRQFRHATNRKKVNK